VRIDEVLKKTRQQLEAISDDARLDAERIVLESLKQKEAAWLYTHADKNISPDRWEEIEAMVERRRSGEPLAYILGYQEFYGRKFDVTSDVLIPRPETEGLVDAALKVIKKMKSHHKRLVRIADIGTGSGCVAITLIKEADNLIDKVIATDLSEKALKIAKMNAQKHNVGGRILFKQGDLMTPIKADEIDLVVSNPPYVPTAELDEQTFSKETVGLRFEPRQALDGGWDGQMYVSKIKSYGKPAVLETTGGEIVIINL
jgi:release factor glutamine methyltransferase